MNYLFYLGHPAHFHLFKHSIKFLLNKGHNVKIVIKKKDVLENLLLESGFEYENLLPDGRKNGIFFILIGLIKQDLNLLKVALKYKPNVLIGSSPIISHIGFLLRRKSIVFCEDDANQVKLFAYLAYPFASIILSPNTCNNGRWNKKTLAYNSIHELAYLHPKIFKPNLDRLAKMVDIKTNYFLLRFSSLHAYHDIGKEGLTEEFALKIIQELQKFGKVYITTEKELPKSLQAYELKVSPLWMHDVLAFATMLIGDSQTMCAEAAVLGVPFIRINDFVGKLGYLNELEQKYQLGFGFFPNQKAEIMEKLISLLLTKDLRKNWSIKTKEMLKNKFELTEFLNWYFENYSLGKNQLEQKLNLISSGSKITYYDF